MLLLATLVLIGAVVVEPARPFDAHAQPALAHGKAPAEQRYLYVALPGPDDAGADRSVRILVFDIADGHRLVRRIPVWPGRGDDAEVVRGTAASIRAGRFFISTTSRLAAIGRILERYCSLRAVSHYDTVPAPVDGRPVDRVKSRCR